jgi:hypothetical protein
MQPESTGEKLKKEEPERLVQTEQDIQEELLQEQRKTQEREAGINSAETQRSL